jgi:uncharacterized protein YcfJ
MLESHHLSPVAQASKEKIMLNSITTSTAWRPTLSASARVGLLTLLAGACSAALATDYGTVISATPVSAQFAVPQPQCYDEQQQVQQRPSGGGALVGALLGGAIGNSFGGGMGRAAATGLGVVAGAALGDQAEAANNPPTTATVRRCQTAMRYENRVVGYDVVYEYNGQRYSTRTARDPGERIALNVTVAPEGGSYAVPPAPSLPPPVYNPPPVVYAPAPAYGYNYGDTYGYGGPSVVVAPRLVIGGYWRHGYWH